jgi:hypothetical protein
MPYTQTELATTLTTMLTGEDNVLLSQTPPELITMLGCVGALPQGMYNVHNPEETLVSDNICNLPDNVVAAWSAGSIGKYGYGHVGQVQTPAGLGLVISYGGSVAFSAQMFWILPAAYA